MDLIAALRNTSWVGLPDRMADFRVRGFRLDRPHERAVLEGHARAFLEGFNLALHFPGDVHAALARVPSERRGFAYEGAGMLAGFVDHITHGRAGLLARLLDGPGDGYTHLLHVGYGWPPAPLRWPAFAPMPATPLLRWLALDGAGFADIFFGGERALGRLARCHDDPRVAIRLAGAGRALWFVHCADVSSVAAAVAALPTATRTDVWAGVGLAAAYAGCAGPADFSRLARAAGAARPNLLQGVMFAAAARSRCGVVPDHTAAATATLLKADPATVASWTDAAADGLMRRSDIGAYVLWRSRLTARASALSDTADQTPNDPTGASAAGAGR